LKHPFLVGYKIHAFSLQSLILDSIISVPKEEDGRKLAVAYLSSIIVSAGTFLGCTSELR
jgi:hypothetical protein